MRALLALIVLIVTACSGAPPIPSPTPTVFPSASRSHRLATPKAAAAPKPTSKVMVAPNQSQLPCRGESGTIVIGELEDATLPSSLPYRIYLPPCFADLGGSTFPTLYLLHGLYYTDAQWDDLGAGEAADGLIARGEAPPFLIVMPRERKGLDFEHAIVDSLIPFVERTYRARPERSFRAIGGLSRGAGWALRIGLKHPELFASLGLHSPAVLPTDLFEIPDWSAELMPVQTPRLWIDIGDHDISRSSTFELRDLFDELQLNYTWRLFPGEHTTDYWASHVTTYLQWYSSPWSKMEDNP